MHCALFVFEHALIKLCLSIHIFLERFRDIIRICTYCICWSYAVVPWILKQCHKHWRRQVTSKMSSTFPCLNVIYIYEKLSCAIIILLGFPNRYIYMLLPPPSSSNVDNDRCYEIVARILPICAESKIIDKGKPSFKININWPSKSRWQTPT